MTTSVAERRVGDDKAAWFAAAILAGIAALTQTHFGMMGDVEWLIDCCERWLRGEVPYRDFIEINPPASLLLYLPAVAVARALGISSELAVSVFGFALAGGALALSAGVLRRAAPLGPGVPLMAVLALVVLPGQTFGQRDHLAAMLGSPFVALILARAERAPVAAPLALLAGLGAGLMACVKPPYALIAVLPAIYVFVRCGWREVLAAPEGYVATFVGVIYLASIRSFFPHYAVNVLPFLLDVYVPLRESLARLLDSTGARVAILIGVTTMWTATRRGLSLATVVFGLAAVGAALAYGIQGKGWIYQAVPAMMFAAVAGAAALERRTGFAGFSVAAITAASGLNFLHSLGPPLLAGAGAGLAVEAVASRVWPEFARLAPMALASAIGLACGLSLVERPLTPALEARLAQYGPGLTLGSISDEEGLAFPLARRVHARWVMRSHSLIVSAAASALQSLHPKDAALTAKLQTYVERDRAALLADLFAKRPDALLVGPLNSPLHADLWADPQVQAVIAEYGLVQREEGPNFAAELWLRKDR